MSYSTSFARRAGQLRFNWLSRFFVIIRDPISSCERRGLILVSDTGAGSWTLDFDNLLYRYFGLWEFVVETGEIELFVMNMYLGAVRRARGGFCFKFQRGKVVLFANFCLVVFGFRSCKFLRR